MTYKQKITLDFIKKYWKDNGYSPSYQDIANHMMISTTAVKWHVKSLAKRNIVSQIPGASRSITVN